MATGGSEEERRRSEAEAKQRDGQAEMTGRDGEGGKRRMKVEVRLLEV